MTLMPKASKVQLAKRNKVTSKLIYNLGSRKTVVSTEKKEFAGIYLFYIILLYNLCYLLNIYILQCLIFISAFSDYNKPPENLRRINYLPPYRNLALQNT